MEVKVKCIKCGKEITTNVLYTGSKTPDMRAICRSCSGLPEVDRDSSKRRMTRERDKEEG